jgi:predicted O-methyltransferase YrrM
MICYSYINDYLRSLIKEDDEFLKELRKYAQSNHVPIIHIEVENFLLALGLMNKPKKILEIGTAIGYSAIVLSKIVSKNGRIDTIERSEKMLNEALRNISKVGLSKKINVIQGEAIEVLNFLDTSYDMIFLDGAKGQYKEFLHHCIRLLNKDGILITDNVLYKGMVATDELVARRKRTIVKNLREYIFKICNSEYFKTSLLPLGDGVAISYKIK